ncbi:hypothetical protein [Mammaliicoccus sciuri]|uniref:hypothetical protein n=1 Tax=Mammaliicoccus sciuri TaxID=1296 RepID=UPI000D1FD3C2|nr:hypothetical protein [Mammaliicoccus sciuri]PTJ53802.1 hypothetical protein BU009_13205 [Mammaliicoccus sciuri]
MDTKQKVNLYLQDKKSNKNYWYASQHDWRVSSICYGVSILQEFQKDKSTDIVKFYDKRSKQLKKENEELKISDTNRSLINAHYLGLMDGIDEKYSDKKVTNVFNKINERVNKKFENVNLYKDIIESQMEKMYLQRRKTSKKQGGIQKDNDDSNILVHPLFVLYKVLLTIQNYTNKYEISMEEFRIFVCYIKDYNEVYKTIEYILISRLMDKDVIKSAAGNINNIRIHLALKQLETLDFNSKSIKLNNKFIDEIRCKVSDYEKEILPKMNRENMDRALHDDKNIFEFYKGV